MRGSSGLVSGSACGLTGHSVTWAFPDRSGTRMSYRFICHACSLVTRGNLYGTLGYFLLPEVRGVAVERLHSKR